MIFMVSLRNKIALTVGSVGLTAIFSGVATMKYGNHEMKEVAGRYDNIYPYPTDYELKHTVYTDNDVRSYKQGRCMMDTGLIIMFAGCTSMFVAAGIFDKKNDDDA
jgi:hypothetical protein